VGSSPIHLGVLRIRACTSCAISMLKKVRTRTRTCPHLDKHERVYVGSLLRKRNEMKRPFHHAAAGLKASHLLLQLPSTDFISRRARMSPMLDRRTNDDRPNDACVHTCASTHSGSLLMSARNSACMHSADAQGALLWLPLNLKAYFCNKFVIELL